MRDTHGPPSLSPRGHAGPRGSRHAGPRGSRHAARAPPRAIAIARSLARSQAQARLLAKVKKMNAQTVELDNVAKEMKGMLGAQKKQLQELNNELAERKGARAARRRNGGGGGGGGACASDGGGASAMTHARARACSLDNGGGVFLLAPAAPGIRHVAGPRAAPRGAPVVGRARGARAPPRRSSLLALRSSLFARFADDLLALGSESKLHD